jgi:hypothetical protein
MKSGAATAAYANEASLAARWGAGLRPPLRLEDGRSLRVVFPGIPGGGSGPDYTGAVLDAGGDLLRGDVELHLRASGWRDHGHARDQAYARVVLHVVAENDTAALTTLHASGRAIPVLVLPPGGRQAAFPPPFTPPCALAARQADPSPVLSRMGERRLRIKAARVAPLVASDGPGQALYALFLEMLGGSANRGQFAALARRIPLAALLERIADASGGDVALAAAAELKGEAARLALRRAGLRPMASPARRLEALARLVGRLWPAGSEPGWPPLLAAGVSPRQLRVEGLGREMAIELMVNAVLPVALAAGAWPADAVLERWHALPRRAPTEATPSRSVAGRPVPRRRPGCSPPSRRLLHDGGVGGARCPGC